MTYRINVVCALNCLCLVKEQLQARSSHQICLQFTHGLQDIRDCFLSKPEKSKAYILTDI